MHSVRLAPAAATLHAAHVDAIPALWACACVQEIATFFGMQPAEPLQPDVGGSPDTPYAEPAPVGDATDIDGGLTGTTAHAAASQASPAAEDFSFKPNEPRPTDSVSLAHPKPTPSGRLTHVDKDGRASMVNVGKVRHLANGARVLHSMMLPHWELT